MTDRLAAAYDDFQAAQREVRELIEATPRFQKSEEHRAQAYASLAQASAMAYAQAVAPRPGTTRLHAQTAWHSTIFSLGTNCQDFRYGVTLLDGRQTYRMRGRLGALKLALFQVQSGVMGTPGSEEIGNYDMHDHADADGSFDVLISATEQEGTWFAIDGSNRYNYVILRRILGDVTDDAGEFVIEQVDGPASRPETDPDEIADRFGIAAHLVRFIVRDWAIGLQEFYTDLVGDRKNHVAHIAGKQMADDLLGSPSTTYGFALYDLQPDEALIVEWDPPDSAYWSFQLGDVWSNALDFTSFQTEVNMDRAVVDSDGRVRLVVSDTDPGVPNWLDTRGRAEGQLILRNYKARGESLPPESRVVKLADVAAELPSDHPRVTPEERQAALRVRRARYLKAFGD